MIDLDRLEAQVRRLQLHGLRATGTSPGQHGGAARGAGLAFAEHREYVPGDDFRRIDWIVTARFGRPYIRLFHPDRAQTVMVLVDMSASLSPGTPRHGSAHLATEVAALLLLASATSEDHVGALFFTDRVEQVFWPARGRTRVLQMARALLAFSPQHKRTSIAVALDAVRRSLRARSLVVVISDFADSGYDHALRACAAHHDVRCIALVDPRRAVLPDVGVIEVEDAETGDRRTIDTGTRAQRGAWEAAARLARQQRVDSFRAAGVDWLELRPDTRYFGRLVSFFGGRNGPR